MLHSRTDGRKYRNPRSVRHDGALSRYVAEGGSRSLAGAHAKELRVSCRALFGGSLRSWTKIYYGVLNSQMPNIEEAFARRVMECVK